MADKNVLNMILTFQNITRISVDIKAQCYLMLILTSTVQLKHSFSVEVKYIFKYLGLAQAQAASCGVVLSQCKIQ